MGERWFGFDLASKTVTLFDDSTIPITCSSTHQTVEPWQRF